MKAGAHFRNEPQKYQESDIASVAVAVDRADIDRSIWAFNRLVVHIRELEQQRDAALKLADEILIHKVSPLLRDSEWVMGRMDGKRDVANKIRAIFEPKE